MTKHSRSKMAADPGEPDYEVEKGKSVGAVGRHERRVSAYAISFILGLMLLVIGWLVFTGERYQADLKMLDQRVERYQADLKLLDQRIDEISADLSKLESEVAEAKKR